MRYLLDNYNSKLFFQSFLFFVLANLIAKNFSLLEFCDSFFEWVFLLSFIFVVAYVFVLQGKDFLKLSTLLAFSVAPIMLEAPLQILSFDNDLLLMLFQLLISLWVFNLQLIAVSTICQVSTGKAALLYLLIPLTVIFFTVFFVLKLFGSLMANLFG